MFKIYLRVFKILFKGVQHIHNTIYIYIYSLRLTNHAHPYHNVEPPLFAGRFDNKLVVQWVCVAGGFAVHGGFWSQIGGFLWVFFFGLLL
jgi:hypothetical protein